MRKEQQLNIKNKIQQKTTIITHDETLLPKLVDTYKDSHKSKKLAIQTTSKIKHGITYYIATISTINPRTLKAK